MICGRRRRGYTMRHRAVAPRENSQRRAAGLPRQQGSRRSMDRANAGGAGTDARNSKGRILDMTTSWTRIATFLLGSAAALALGGAATAQTLRASHQFPGGKGDVR